ncbi:major facilitator superfamily domain-containing protein [Aspergillus granulosus]|uniref:Major facilitator superfamily domain-containing protein n=1 Tax=Aspergillus granulosus TaxID=176169 RepID=A0ABR4HT27_9EURO
MDAKKSADLPDEKPPALAVAEGELEDTDDGTLSRLRWKLDMRLLPLLCLTYALQSIDKTTLSYAAVFGLEEDLHLKGTEFSWLGALFYLGYLVWEFPTNVFLQKLPINYFMAGTVIVWGAVLMLHGTSHNFSSQAAARTFLGAFEASINPGTMLLFSMYYSRSEQPLRMGIWIGAAGLGYVIAGIASFGIGHIHSAIASWRLLYIIWGAITVAWGVILVLWLPGSPLTTRFLNESERALVVVKVKNNGTGVENKKFKWEQFWEAMRDAKTWLLFLFAVASNSPNGGLTSFQGLIIRGMGFSTLRTTLIQMPSGAVQLVICPLACFFASHYPNARILIMILCIIPFLAGVLGLWLIAESNPYSRLVCLWISFAYTAAWTLCMSVATANTAGHTKKITTNATLLIGYTLGNFIGPFFFKTEQAPVYPLGVGMMFFCIAVQVLCLLALWGLLWMRNRSRQGKWEAEGVNEGDRVRMGYERGMRDETDLENEFFQYVY